MQKQKQLELLAAYAKPKRRPLRKSTKSAQRRRVAVVEVENKAPGVDSQTSLQDMECTASREKQEPSEEDASLEKGFPLEDLVADLLQGRHGFVLGSSPPVQLAANTDQSTLEGKSKPIFPDDTPPKILVPSTGDRRKMIQHMEEMQTRLDSLKEQSQLISCRMKNQELERPRQGR